MSDVLNPWEQAPTIDDRISENPIRPKVDDKNRRRVYSWEIMIRREKVTEFLDPMLMSISAANNAKSYNRCFHRVVYHLVIAEGWSFGTFRGIRNMVLPKAIELPRALQDEQRNKDES